MKIFIVQPRQIYRILIPHFQTVPSLRTRTIYQWRIVTRLLMRVFMRSTNTPKERLKMACSSMVACYGKGFALCCVPLIAVSQPVTRYRQSLRTFAVTSKYLFSGVTAMLYLFKAVSRSDLRNTKNIFLIPTLYRSHKCRQYQASHRTSFPVFCDFGGEKCVI